MKKSINLFFLLLAMFLWSCSDDDGNNGGIDAATEQIRAKQYVEPFKADKRRVTALAIELDDKGKGLTDWKEV